MLLNWLLSSSVVENNNKPTNPHSWTTRKNEPLAFLNIATRRPWTYMHLYCFNLVQCRQHEIFLPPEFQIGIANFRASRTSWFQQAQPHAQSPNTLCHLSSHPKEFPSCLSLQSWTKFTALPTHWEQQLQLTTVPWAGGKPEVTGSGTASCFVLAAQIKQKQDKLR